MAYRVSTRRTGVGILNRLRMYASGAATTRASVAISETLVALADRSFQTRTSPDGDRWAPRKPPTGTWPLLEKTRAMRSAFFTTVFGPDVILRNGAPYSQFHQTGTVYMDARQIFPDGRLPEEWASAINAAVRRSLGR